MEHYTENKLIKSKSCRNSKMLPPRKVCPHKFALFPLLTSIHQDKRQHCYVYHTEHSIVNSITCIVGTSSIVYFLLPICSVPDISPPKMEYTRETTANLSSSCGWCFFEQWHRVASSDTPLRSVTWWVFCFGVVLFVFISGLGVNLKQVAKYIKCKMAFLIISH